METKLREHVEGLFENAPKSRKAAELQEEMIQNLMEKYRDLVALGKSPEDAYNQVVGGIGDVQALLRDLERRDPAQYEAARKRRALLTAVAIALYILCVVPVLLLEDVAGVVLMFLFIAAATGLIIYNNMTKPAYERAEDTLVEDFREWQHVKTGRDTARKSIRAAVWSVAVVAYFILSLLTFRWGITWVVFLVAGAVTRIIDACFDLRAAGKGGGQ